MQSFMLLSKAQASSSIKCLDMCTFMYATPTLITKELHLYSSTAAFNDCYSELTPYTALANSYWVSVYNVYQCQGHTH